MIEAFRRGEAALVAPFKYSSLLWATLFGYLFWTELPDRITLFGAAIVVMSGLYIIYRETRAGLAQRQLTSMSPDDTGQ